MSLLLNISTAARTAHEWLSQQWEQWKSYRKPIQLFDERFFEDEDLNHTVGQRAFLVLFHPTRGTVHGRNLRVRVFKALEFDVFIMGMDLFSLCQKVSDSDEFTPRQRRKVMQAVAEEMALRS